MRNFNPVDSFAAEIHNHGNLSFYRVVCGLGQLTGQATFPPDLTKLNDIATVRTSAAYLYREMLPSKGPEAAEVAHNCYMRGYSRIVNAPDHNDWERLRSELRLGMHLGSVPPDGPEEGVTIIAISYKGKEVKITRRMRLLNEDGSPADDEGILAQTEIQMTQDFVDDFRWSQLVRSCMAVAKQEGTNKVRIWVDRLVMMGLDKDERKRIYSIIGWEAFGLFAYAVCPVIRLYDAQEKYYGSDFWRKLETVLGVAGKGLVLDDYMLRKYDDTIFFGPKIYSRLQNGLSKIGGGGIYIRSVTLALATALLTDGLSVSAANEDLRTRKSAVAWKAWALRTIAEGAYSTQHSSMMREEAPFKVGHRQFMIISFWESMVSRCPSLIGNSYLDMSYQRSMQWRKSSCWDGIVEWVGMLHGSCEIEERPAIMNFLKQQTSMSLWASTTGHVASILTLSSPGLLDRRTLVVDLSRFSTSSRGHVTAVAEATGIWREKVLPFYLRHHPSADKDQMAEVTDQGVVYTYKAMKIEYSWMPTVRIVSLIVFNLILIVFTFGIWLVVALIQLLYYLKPWPWVDLCDVGEAVFDNLLLHALYGAGIKKQYRKLRDVPYDQIGWTGISDERS